MGVSRADKWQYIALVDLALPNAQPVKWMKLIQWWLLHRVPTDMIITPQIEATACMRFKIPEWKWEEAKKRFPMGIPELTRQN
jgi:hypothetical protein